MSSGARDWRPQPIAGVPDGIILFDGVCLLCSAWVRFIIEHDPEARFRFASVQSVYGGALARRLGIDPGNPETNAVVFGGLAYFKSDAAIVIFARLRGRSWVRIARYLPRAVRDRLYDLVARSRYRVFGRSDVCLMPSPEIAARFVEDELPAFQR